MYCNYLEVIGKYFLRPAKEVLVELGYGIGTEEFICIASSYNKFFPGLVLKDVENMVY